MVRGTTPILPTWGPSCSGPRSISATRMGSTFSCTPWAACSAQPREVMAGKPATVTANPRAFNPTHTVGYNWTSTGGKVDSRATPARVDTTGMSPGSYTVTARATDARAKKNNEATCTANFTIKEPPKNPPTMSCSANPTTVQSGTPSTITCDCKSPDNVPVNVEYS